MNWLVRWLGLEIAFVHVGHGLLFLVAAGLIAWFVPWWGVLLLMPVFAASAAVWAFEAKFVMPPAVHMMRRGETMPLTSTLTTRPRGKSDGPRGAKAADEPSIRDTKG